MRWSDWLFLAVGGFLVGAFLYTGYTTMRSEPESRPGYALIGAGVVVVVVANVWLKFHVDASSWFMAAMLFGFGLSAAGLVLIVRTRRRKRG